MGFAANLHRITRRLRGADVTGAHVESLLLQSEASSALYARPLDNPRFAPFARTLSSLDELDPPARAALVEHLEGGQAIRRIVVAPRQRLLGAGPGWRRWLTFLLPWELTPDWVLVLTDDCLLAASFARAGVPPVVTATPIAAIVSLELGTVLLHSWLEWTCAGQPALAAPRSAGASRRVQLVQRGQRARKRGKTGIIERPGIQRRAGLGLEEQRLDVRPGDVRPPQAARHMAQAGGKTHQTPPLIIPLKRTRTLYSR